MFTISLLLMLVSATPYEDGREQRQTKRERAARLMTVEELTQLEDLERQVTALRRPNGNVGLLAGSITLMAFGAVIPIALAIVGVVGTVFVGFAGIFGALVGSLAIWAFIPTMWVGLFSWIPVWGWIAMGVTAAAGGAMLIAAQANDAPRRAAVHALQVERKNLIELALSRERSAMLQVPMTTLATF